jgi:hypothetical protein
MADFQSQFQWFLALPFVVILQMFSIGKKTSWVKN